MFCPRCAHEKGPHLRRSAMEGYIKRADPKFDYPLYLFLSQVIQGNKVAMKEGEPIIIILKIESPPQPVGHLIYKTEQALAIAFLDSIKKRIFKFNSQILGSFL
jgi:hypothetical protein